MANGIKTLNTFDSPDLKFDTIDTADFSDTNLMFEGARVDEARNAANATAADFVEKINELANKISSITDTGVSSTNVTGAIRDFKTKLGNCSDTIGTYGNYFSTIVDARLETMATQERLAADRAANASTFDRAMDSVTQRASNILNYVKTVGNGLGQVATGAAGTVGSVASTGASLGAAVGSAAYETGKDVGNAAANAYNTASDWMYDNVTEPVLDTVTSIPGNVANAYNNAQDWIFDNVTAPVGNTISQIGSGLGNVANTIAGAYNEGAANAVQVNK